MNQDPIDAADNQSDEPANEFIALQTIIKALQPLLPETRRRIFDAAATFLQIHTARSITARSGTKTVGVESKADERPAFSADTDMSPKEFLLEKQPTTDVERVACLAFYLTHYRDLPHFKTLEISKLNTEAAQPKFANAAYSSSNAVKQGYIVPSSKGQKQLSAAGEQFVRALPDRAAAREAMAAARPRRRVKRVKTVKKSS